MKNYKILYSWVTTSMKMFKNENLWHPRKTFCGTSCLLIGEEQTKQRTKDASNLWLIWVAYSLIMPMEEN